MSAQLNGFRLIPGYFDRTAQIHLIAAVRAVLRKAPLYTPTMPKSGRPLSVRMSNCGTLGWVTDKAGGYRYQATHPVTGLPWPAMPDLVLDAWNDLADYAYRPEACLINYYAGKARLGQHRDADEHDAAAPVISISLGDEAVFHIGGLKRSEPKERITLASGDVVVLGGEARHAYHGIDKVLPGTSDVLAEGGRFNLTLRRVSPPDRQ